jgi:hypothetical protein
MNRAHTPVPKQKGGTPISPNPTPPRFASVETPPSLAEELLGRLVVFQPGETRLVDTELGESTATFARVVSIDAAGVVQDHEDRPIFWTVVRDQLRAATADRPWIAGRFVKTGRAYRLAPLTAADAKTVGKALDQVEA